MELIKKIESAVVARVCWMLCGILLSIVGLFSPSLAELVVVEIGKAVRK